MAIKTVHHIAFAVEDLEHALRFWQELLGTTANSATHVPTQAVDVAFLSLGSTEIELLKPASPDSGVAKWIRKHGPGIHHISLAVDDLSQTLVTLAARGVTLIDTKPRSEIAGKLYAFVHPKSTGGVLLELYQELETP